MNKTMKFVNSKAEIETDPEWIIISNPVESRVQRLLAYDSNHSDSIKVIVKDQGRRTLVNRVEEVFVNEIHEHNMSEYSLRLNIARNHPLFTLTMAFPIMMIACIAPFGILIPIESGEKMGYQMTLFLTLIVYLEIKSHSVPVPENSTSISKLIIFFIVIIILLVLCILGMLSNSSKLPTRPSL